MSNIHVIISSGNPTTDQVLKGVYGSLREGATPEQVIFSAAAEFRGVSHLFAQAPSVPLPREDVLSMDVPDADDALVKGQIFFNLGARWARLYEGRGRMLGRSLPAGFTQQLLDGERNQVATGTRAFLESQGMNVYEVPVLVRGEVLAYGGDIETAGQMLAGIAPIGRTVELDASRPVRMLMNSALTGDSQAVANARVDARALAAQEAARAQQPGGSPVRNFIRSIFHGLGMAEPQREEPEQAAAEDAAQGEAEAAPNWSEFRGVAATVAATTFVVAPNEAAIPTALTYSNQLAITIAEGMQMEPAHVVAVADLQREDLTPNFDNDDGYGDENYRG